MNQVTGAGIAGATVTLFTRQEVRYQAVTDAFGSFRIASADPGMYEAVVEKSGFVLFPKEPLQIPSASSARLRYEMQFGRRQQATLSGRILDSQDKPAAGAQVELIRGPEWRQRTTTEANGRFVFEKLNPGPYTLRAIPAHPPEIATYFPSSLEEKDAQRIVVRGNTTVEGFWLQTAPTVRVQGRVVDETGTAAAKAEVKLLAMTQSPAHVGSSFGAYFTVLDEGPSAGAEEARVIAGDDGRFEFPAVRAGEWRIVAEAAPRIDASTGFNLAPWAFAAVSVRANDFQNVELRLEPLFAMSGSSRWLVAQCHDPTPPNPSCSLDSRVPPKGIVYPIWFHGLDGLPSTLNLGVLQPDGTFQLPHLHPGRYAFQPLPILPDPNMPADGHVNDSSAPALSLNTLALDVGPGSPKIEPGGGGYFDPDGTRPVFAPVMIGPGSVRGTVEKGSGASVVFLPELYAQGSLGLLVFCQPDGTFNAARLAPGSYYVAAFDGLDMEGLRDPEVLRRVVASGNRVRVMGDAEAELDLALSPWPE